MARVNSLLLLLSFFSCVVFGLPYTKDSPVISLNKNNFAKEVFGSEHVWLIEFYAPWCGHCKNLAPDYEKLAKNLKGIVKIGAVNGDEEQQLAQTYGVKGFPTLKMFPSKIKSDGKGNFHKEPMDYNGQRTAGAMSEFVLSQLPNYAIPVTSKSVKNFTETEPNVPKALLFSNKKDVTSLFKALAIDFHYALNLGVVRDTEKAIVEEYKVEKFPTLMVIPTPGAQPVLYSGELKHESLFKFLKGYALPTEKDKSSSSSSTKKEERIVRNVQDEVKDQKTFESLCYDKSIMCIVSFLDPENSGPESHERYLSTLDKVNQKNGDKFTFLWADGLKQYEFLDKLNLATGFPSLLLVNQKKLAVLPLRGAYDEGSINEFLDTVLRGGGRPIVVKSLPSFSSPIKSEL